MPRNLVIFTLLKSLYFASIKVVSKNDKCKKIRRGIYSLASQFLRFIILFLGNYKSVASCFSLIYNADIAVVGICECEEIVAEKIHL